MSGRIGAMGSGPHEWYYGGRDHVFFAAEPDIHHDSLAALALPPLPPAVREQLTGSYPTHTESRWTRGAQNIDHAGRRRVKSGPMTSGIAWRGASPMQAHAPSVEAGSGAFSNAGALSGPCSVHACCLDSVHQFVMGRPMFTGPQESASSGMTAR